MIIRLVIAEDNAICRSGIASFLKHTDGIVVEAAVANAKETLANVRLFKPKVVLLDCHLKDAPAVWVASMIRQDKLDTFVLALSEDADDASIQEMFFAGVSGYLLKKELNHERLVKVIQTVVLEEKSLIPFISCKPFYKLQPSPDPEKDLTARELEVFELLAQGYDNRQIANLLTLRVQSVKNYTSRIYDKLNAKNRLQAIQQGLKRGLLKRTKIVLGYSAP